MNPVRFQLGRNPSGRSNTDSRGEHNQCAPSEHRQHTMAGVMQRLVELGLVTHSQQHDVGTLRDGAGGISCVATGVRCELAPLRIDIVSTHREPLREPSGHGKPHGP
jgi:hypothetical protein